MSNLTKQQSKLGKFWHKNGGQVVLHFFFIIISLCYVLPLMIVVSASLTDEAVLTNLATGGFSIFPQKFSLEAYKQVFADPKEILQGYGVTIAFSAISTVLHILVLAMMAYPLSRDYFFLRKPINFLILLMMLFSAGTVPSYVVNTQVLGLFDNFWVYVLPGIFSCWNLIIVRTNYKNIPTELIESARLDGASELRVCFSIAIPLTKAALASIGFLFLVGKWNDWMTTSIYIRSMDLYSLQYLLQRILQEAEFIRSMIEQGLMMQGDQKIPEESYRYAMAVVAAGPMMFVFPFFQKYFAKGMTLGSVKG